MGRSKSTRKKQVVMVNGQLYIEAFREYVETHVVPALRFAGDAAEDTGTEPLVMGVLAKRHGLEAVFDLDMTFPDPDALMDERVLRLGHAELMRDCVAILCDALLAERFIVSTFQLVWQQDKDDDLVVCPRWTARRIDDIFASVEYELASDEEA